MAAKYSLKATGELLLHCYAEDVIDLTEFVVLYKDNQSRDVYLYWKCTPFDLDSLDDS